MSTSQRHTITITIEGAPPTRRCIDPAALAAVLTLRTTASRNRLEAVRSNYAPALRARGFVALADDLERAVADVIGRPGDPSRPGALGRMLAEVDELLTTAEDC